MVDLSKKYPAKLILFGEYSVIQTGTALAIPLSRFSGSWEYADCCDRNLEALARYLLRIGLDSASASLKNEIQNGLQFKSNIPQGYGLGSSGALTAAVFDQFVYRQWPSLAELKKALGSIESHFHGSSSGTDPLVSYLQKSVWLDNNEIKLPALHTSSSSHKLFLLDSGTSRDTSAMVKIYNQSAQNKTYLDTLSRYLFHYVDDAIAAFFQEDEQLLFELFHEISHFQFRYFSDMIPEAIRSIWLDGLNSDQFKIKLCGAGGGGYFLGMGDMKPLLESVDKDRLVRL